MFRVAFDAPMAAGMYTVKISSAAGQLAQRLVVR